MQRGVFLLAATVHMHVTAWFMGFVFFGLGWVFHKTGKVQAEKIVLMFLRIFYFFIIITGFLLLGFLAEIPSVYVMKTISGVLVIAFCETVLARKRKGKSTLVYWIFLLLLFVFTLFLGIKLPL